MIPVLLLLGHGGLQESGQVDVLISDFKFTTNLFTVPVHSGFGYPPQFGNLLGPHAVTNQVTNGNFGWGHGLVGAGDPADKRGSNFIKVGFENSDVVSL